MDNDIELYKGMKFSDLVSEIVDNSRNKRNQIDILIADLRTFIKSPGEALTIVPLVRDYIDVGVKNDDQLVKLSAVMQRVMAANTVATGVDNAMGGITEEEKEALRAEVEASKKAEKDVDAELDAINAKKDKVLSKDE